VLGHASDFLGQISGFTGTSPDTAHSDAIDLKDISFGSNITFAYDDNAGTDTGGTLTIFGSGNTVDSITFANGEYTTASFTLSSDGSGGTLITDPPTPTTPTTATTTSSSDSADTLIGGSNGNNTITGGVDHDSFVFKAITDSQPGVDHFDTITDFTHNSDHIDFAAINGLNSTVQAVTFHSLAAAAGSIDPHAIDIVMIGGNVAQSDFILHH
jgi:Peptidase M10 serralysin C terminal